MTPSMGYYVTFLLTYLEVQCVECTVFGEIYLADPRQQPGRLFVPSCLVPSSSQPRVSSSVSVEDMRMSRYQVLSAG
ncbi:hypothetical protein BDV32DRAFT_118171 [Aspergillus pseudonomiae]|nr:hypothetical protein BDV32DRAFT_118171 [Aspergillus pseudonomiae]